ncbi:SRPBCC family protein [Pseudotenacibaculum haliotis]|uniref:SRPBCC family protein n=1 Tax=Pseudotenacibaculum haliotis TaxID=1862138 RepID=A0ABW5LYP3_9FLAO
MKFTCTVTINKPLSIVTDFFVNPDYIHEYQEGFQKKELISGSAWQEGAVSKLYYAQGKRTMELTETIIKNDLPNEFYAQYHHIFTDNTMRSVFTAVSDDVTRYDAEIHYTEFRGFMVKTMSFLFPSFFKKQVQKWLNNFKRFLENQ